MTAFAEETVPTPDEAAAAALPDAWAWAVAEWVGLLLALGGLVDLVLVWQPAHWASPDWTFGAVSESAAVLPLPSLGAGMLVGGALARGHRGVLRTTGALLVAVALLLIAAYVVFAFDVRSAMAAVKGQNPVTVLSVRRLVAKTSVTLVLLGAGLFTLGVSALSGSFARRPGGG